MTTYNCIIIDDETIARELLESYVAKIAWLHLVATCTNAMDAQTAIAENQPDIIFLDIQMPDMTGLDLLRFLKNKPATILTTAYSEYAVEGFELDVVDYLLKPIEFARFFKAANKAKDFLDKNSQSSPTPTLTPESSESAEKTYFFVKTDQKLQRIEFADLLYVEALQKYVRFHTTSGRHVSLMSMMQVLDELPDAQFVRIHRSTIVNIGKIDNVEGNIVRIAGKMLPISKGNRESFLEKLK